MRPIRYRFDPAAVALPTRPRLRTFDFLETALSSSVDGLENCNVFDPRTANVPWPTSFPAVAQSKYWEASEAAATELMDRILTANPTLKGAVPEELNVAVSRADKQVELLETSVTAPINMFPMGNVNTARILAKANVLIFMHDDVIESRENKDSTVIDQALSSLSNPNSQDALLSENPIFREFAQEVLTENTETGQKLIEGILSWVKHTRDSTPGNTTFTSFTDYIQYRIKDFAVEFCDAAIMMSAGINITQDEMSPLRHIHHLYMTHFSLTNDLYSYEKEIKARNEKGSAVVNGVQVLTELLLVSPLVAKIMLRAILWDLEHKINGEHEQLVQNGGLGKNQLRFIQGMVVTLAGNTFYSATTTRYGKAAIGEDFP